MSNFSFLRKKLDYLSKKQLGLVEQAYLFASDAHISQKRSSGEPYICHPLAVACILADMRMDQESIMSALLHDVIEDTEFKKDSIKKIFGKAVADIVDGVTKLTKMQFPSVAEAQAESFRKMILAMSNDIRVILVKLADRLHNMSTIGALATYKRHRIAKETLDVYAPIALRLGIYDVYSNLESMSFNALYPKRCRVIEKAIEIETERAKSEIKAIKKEIKKRLSKENISKIEITNTQASAYSFYRRIKEQQISLKDVIAVHMFSIVVDDKDTCYRVLGLLHELYQPIPGKFKDYIAIPKINGYKSLHTTVFVSNGISLELHIKTNEMDLISKKGIIAHNFKKGKKEKTQTVAEKWLSDVLDMQQKTSDSLEFVENVKIDLFQEEVYVFTPKGMLIKLLRGSTPVDFAYAIHTEVGNACIGAKVDQRLVPLSTKLNNGQIVSIIVSQNAHPNPMWLKFVKTGRAKSSIRNFLKNQNKTDLIILGQRLLDKSLQDFSLNISKIPKPAFLPLLKEMDLPNIDALYENIGSGKQSSMRIARQLIGKNEEIKTFEKEEKQTESLLITGTENMAVKIATCCRPIPGDLIVGYMKEHEGLVIHREGCKNDIKIRQQPEKCIRVSWSENINKKFPILIQIFLTNEKETILKIIETISNMDSYLEKIDGEYSNLWVFQYKGNTKSSKQSAWEINVAIFKPNFLFL